jgi:hypothetical protein
MLHSPSISTSPSPFIPIHPFNPPHWREESREEKRRKWSREERNREETVERRQL